MSQVMSGVEYDTCVFRFAVRDLVKKWGVPLRKALCLASAAVAKASPPRTRTRKAAIASAKSMAERVAPKTVTKARTYDARVFSFAVRDLVKKWQVPLRKALRLASAELAKRSPSSRQAANVAGKKLAERIASQ